MKTNCIVLSDGDLADVRAEMEGIRRIVQSAAGALAVQVRTNAPKKTGDLIAGIVQSPWEEKSAFPGKIVRQVYFDDRMNDVFVKMAKNGKRYYYPASQEFGFRIARRSTLTPHQSAVYKIAARQNRVPGKYFMRETFAEYVPTFVEDVEQFVNEVICK